MQIVYEVDPHQCPKCSHTMRIIAVIDVATIIQKILKHQRLWGPTPEQPEHPARDPPWPADIARPSLTMLIVPRQNPATLR